MPTFQIQAPDGSVYQIDGENERGALAALQSHLATQSGFQQRAAQMDPTSLSVARSKNDAFGEFLRNEAMKPRAGEAPASRDARLYGKPMLGPSQGESFSRGAADMMSFGFGDEIAAGVEAATGGRGYADALQRQRDSANVASKNNPWSYGGGELAGALATALPSLMAGGGPTAGGLLGQAAKSAGTGAAAAGLYGYGSGEGGTSNRLASAANAAAWGGALGAAAPVVAKGFGSVVGALTKPKVTGPATAAIKGTSKQAFTAVDQMGVVLSPQAYDSIAAQVENAAGQAGLFPKNHPQLANALAELDKYRSSPVPVSLLQDIRQMLQSSYSIGNPSQNHVMSSAVDALDNGMANINPSHIINGNAADAVAKLGTARAEWAKFRKAELMDKMVSNAENAVGANYTQAGFQTALRQQLRALAKDDFKTARYFTPDEKRMILDVVRGGKVENVMRWMGKFSALTPGGMTRSAASGYVGSLMGGPVAGATVAGLLGSAGTVARPISTHLGKKAFNSLDAAVRTGGRASVASRYSAPARKIAQTLLGSSSTPLGGLLGSLVPIFPPSRGLLGHR